MLFFFPQRKKEKKEKKIEKVEKTREKREKREKERKRKKRKEKEMIFCLMFFLPFFSKCSMFFFVVAFLVANEKKRKI